MAYILIVEDEERIAQFIAKGLQKRGMATAVAGDGAQALVQLSEQSFDGVLLDLGLPVLDGWAVLEQLNASPKQSTQSSPTAPAVVIMTAAAEETHAEQAYALGAKAYVRKPFRFETLLNTLIAALAEP